jgi:DnaK suppressor protein
MQPVFNLVRVRRYLSQEAERLEKEIVRAEDQTKASAPLAGDEGDSAARAERQIGNQALVEDLQRLLSQVQAARRGLDDGTYGHCADCHQPIPIERMRAIPYATYCIHCETKRERTRGNHRNPGLGSNGVRISMV